MVIEGRSPSLAAGGERSFSLLFPMPRVFESFVAGLLQRNRNVLASVGEDTHIGVQNSDRPLLRDSHGARHIWLRPDVVGSGPTGSTRFVLDTKWKILASREPITAVTAEDVYQLHAYAAAYESPLSILLYPAMPGNRPRTYRFETNGRPLRIAFLDLTRDLREDGGSLIAELAAVISVDGKR